MNPVSIYRKDILAIVASLRPDRVLLVMPQDGGLIDEINQTFPRLHLTHISGNQVAASSLSLQPCKLAIVGNTLEFMDKQTARAIIARLRDLYCRFLLVAVPIGREWRGLRSHWETGELRALGLRLLRRYTYRGKPLHLYQFDIIDYKSTPDWLNSRHWANPDMWDKARW